MFFFKEIFFTNIIYNKAGFIISILNFNIKKFKFK